MDGTRFDEITQRLATAATRRRIVGGALGAAALVTGAALAHFDDADAKKGKRKAKGKGKGKGGNGNGKGKGRNKVFVCHNAHGHYRLLRVAEPSLKKGHSRHGDTVCEPGVCETGNPTGCDQDTGACTGFDLAPEGTECEVDGVAGTCSADGECVPVVECAGEGESCAVDEDCCEGLNCRADVAFTCRP
jgi:hypothetical protein